MGNLVAIVGRPNVGKSTLFNRLVGMRQSIVDEVAGVTRDRIYGKSDWNGRTFSVIDTGGYAENTEDVFEEEIRKQVLMAIDEADIILFIVDVTTGITDFDAKIASILRRSSKKVILVTNKVDHGNRLYDAAEFYGLGLGDPFSISSANGSGTGDLLDEVVSQFEEETDAESELSEESKIPRITIVGKPNVGKSSLTNALLGEDRNIVTDVPGTTRDSICTRYNKFGFEFDLVDTAGLRKKTKTKDDLEFYSSMRAIRSIEFSDVCILMVDAMAGIEAQDLSIFSLIIKNKKACVVVINKWDLVQKENNTMKKFTEDIQKRLSPFSDVPIVYTSVLNKQRIFDVLEQAQRVYDNRKRKIQTSKLNEIMLPEIEHYPPPAIKGKYVKIKYITQLPTPSPTFAFFCNLPQYIKESYRRYLENKLRGHFDLSGVPIALVFREK